jgi:hypothetical protein
LQADQLLRERSYPIGVITVPSKVHPHVAAIGPTQARERLSERRDVTLKRGIVFVAPHEHADTPYAVALLRARCERPRRGRTAERSDELPPPDAEHGGFLQGRPDRFELGGRLAPSCARPKDSTLTGGGKQPPALRNFDSVDRAV